MSTIKRRIILALVVALTMSVSGCSSNNSAKSVTVNSGTVKSTKTVDGFGVVKAMDIKNITVDFPAAVKTINVVEGQKVKNQDSLVSLNLKEFEDQIKSKEMSISSESHDIEEIQNDYLSTSNAPDLQKLLNDLKNAQDLYNQVQSEYAAEQTLFNSGGISKYDLDQSKKTVDAKRNDVEDIKSSIDTLKYEKQQTVDSKKTDLAILKSDLAAMKDKLNKSYIKGSDIISDVNHGIVYDIGYVPGDIVSPDKKVLSLLNLDSLIVEANIPEEFIKSVKMSADVDIIPQADKSKTIKGKVIRISDKAVVNNGETDVSVDISFNNSDGFLLPGFNVDVKINQ
ncbi:putative efflux pump membrane fusion protein [Desulfosporosinus acididurans]|uniref:Putative efflux pump membrane fusion protein n=1 Tax=Desulfosporosinus acididurans TaxID=476652 RepID=A0A0J1INX3_9FIRM|nr:efflux RND transporter periplasmic adaptor subunit [Desulfosporosinus acididurans]KLU66371.1 putative efflux pump membrane fusion protein [Desulfosporosinus acididurans]